MSDHNVRTERLDIHIRHDPDFDTNSDAVEITFTAVKFGGKISWPKGAARDVGEQHARAERVTVIDIIVRGDHRIINSFHRKPSGSAG